MTARKILTLMLKEQGLILRDDDMIYDTTQERVVAQFISAKYDDKGGMRYSIKFFTEDDFFNFDLDLDKKNEN